MSIFGFMKSGFQYSDFTDIQIIRILCSPLICTWSIVATNLNLVHPRQMSSANLNAYAQKVILYPKNGDNYETLRLTARGLFRRENRDGRRSGPSDKLPDGIL